MQSIVDVIAFCQEQRAFHESKAALPRYTDKQRAAHQVLAKGFSDSIALIESMQAAGVAPAQLTEAGSGSEDIDKLFEIDPFDLSELPTELVEELSISAADHQDAQIIQLMRLAKRPLSINEILVGLFRKFGQQHKRNPLSARLYRIAQKGDIVSVDKGVYALPDKGGRQSTAKDQEDLI